MKCVTSEKMRELDRRTIEEFGTPGEVLMDRAGLCVAETVQRWVTDRGADPSSIQLLAGRGNNGGDAFTAAWHLADRGFRVEVLLAGTVDAVAGDARTHLQRVLDVGIRVYEWPTEEAWQQGRATVPPAPVLVDGLLGTGTQGPVRGAIAGAIDYMQSAAHAWVVAIDVPSGLDPDTGATEGPAVRADVTVTMGLPKRGLLAPAAVEYVGAIEVADIGFPAEFVDQLEGEPDCQFLHATDVRSLLPKRRRSAHKGSCGHVLLIGGSLDYSGAIILAARAAMRTGSGLVTVLVPESIADRVAIACPEVMVRPARETEIGSLSAENWNEWRSFMSRFSAILVGPGMTQHNDSLVLVRVLIREAPAPLVVDADALQVLGQQAHWLERASVPTVITPHPGEFARLMGKQVEEVQANRIPLASEAAQSTGATVVLKGAQSVIASAGQPSAVNSTGNPGMATGGSGDVLAGMVVSLMGQGLAAYDAARLATWLHGRAGDRIARRTSEYSLIASDLIDELPVAFKDLETL